MLLWGAGACGAGAPGPAAAAQSPAPPPEPAAPALTATPPGVSVASTPAPRDPVAQRVTALMGEAPFNRVLWGIVAVDLSTGEILLEHNADLRFVPASNVKIPVAAAAMGLLGPGYRWRTTFLSTDLPADRVLQGDLFVVSSGDPTLGAPFFDPPERGIEALRLAVAGAGIESVRGALVLDVSGWDSTTVLPTWMVEDLAPAYGATGGAFAIHGGELEIEITAGATVGAPALVGWHPRGLIPFVESAVTTVAPGTEAELHPGYLPESRRWLVTGSVPLGTTRRIRVAQRDPVRLAADVLEQRFRTSGPSPAAETRILWDPGVPTVSGCLSSELLSCPELHWLGQLLSPPLEEVVRISLARSHNWTGEQLLRTLGAELGGEGSTAAGIEVVTEWLVNSVGLDSLSFHLRDGSGLSAFNLVSPRALVEVLAHTRLLPWGETFRNAMASPGRDGTLEFRLSGLEGRVFAKTGTISHVNGLSGYLVAEDGREVAFSVLTNASNMPAQEVRARIDRIVRELALP